MDEARVAAMLTEIAEHKELTLESLARIVQVGFIASTALAEQVEVLEGRVEKLEAALAWQEKDGAQE